MFTIIFCVLACACVAAGDTLTLLVGYCPTDATSGGAIVTVNTTTGNWTIASRFDWPGYVFGCLVDYDPIITFDGDATMYLEFGGAVIPVDMKTGSAGKTITSGDEFFQGFENMFYTTGALSGLSGTVTENGYCDDGCYQFGTLATSKGKYQSLQNIPFKAIMDDSEYYDSSSNTYYVQGSYDLRVGAQACAPNQADECMIAIDVATGDMLSAIGPNNYTVYKYAQQADSNLNVLAFVEGFDDVCKHPYDDFAFATVNLKTAEATLLNCMDHSVNIDEAQWISSFNADDSLFATASGDADAGVAQLLVLDATTGAKVVDTQLPGLKEALKTFSGVFVIWGVQFM